MAHVEVDKLHNLGRSEAMARIGPVQDQLQNKYSFVFIWNGDQAEIKGLGTSGKIWVDDVRIRMELKLNLALRPFSGRIKKMIESGIDDAIAGKLGEL